MSLDYKSNPIGVFSRISLIAIIINKVVNCLFEILEHKLTYTP